MQKQTDSFVDIQTGKFAGEDKNSRGVGAVVQRSHGNNVGLLLKRYAQRFSSFPAVLFSFYQTSSGLGRVSSNMHSSQTLDKLGGIHRTNVKTDSLNVG